MVMFPTHCDATINDRAAGQRKFVAFFVAQTPLYLTSDSLVELAQCPARMGRYFDFIEAARRQLRGLGEISPRCSYRNASHAAFCPQLPAYGVPAPCCGANISVRERFRLLTL